MNKSPKPGSYVGTVNGHHALLLVTDGSVMASWHDVTKGQWNVEQSDNWDNTDGNFSPTVNNIEAEVTINLKSKKPIKQDLI